MPTSQPHIFFLTADGPPCRTLILLGFLLSRRRDGWLRWWFARGILWWLGHMSVLWFRWGVLRRYFPLVCCISRLVARCPSRGPHLWRRENVCHLRFVNVLQELVT